MSSTIRLLNTQDDRELSRAFPVFKFLRPHLDEQRFTRQVRLQQAQGYQIVCAESDGDIVAAAGYRIASFLAWGKVLYVDDLITHPDRKQRGHGGALLDWVVEEAKRLECDEVHLDTGHGRHDAHRLYLNKGFRLNSHHMSLHLKSSDGSP